MAVAAAVVIVIVGGPHIIEAFRTPNLTAILDTRSSLLSREASQVVQPLIDRAELESLIKALEKYNRSPTEILTSLKQSLSAEGNRSFSTLTELGAARPRLEMKSAQIGTRANQLAGFLRQDAFSVRVLNDSNLPATNVRLILPTGKGQFELGPRSVNANPSEWDQEISIGDLGPHSSVFLTVWPEKRFLLEARNAALVHEEGSGVVRAVYGLNGESAEFASWYLANVQTTRTNYLWWGLMGVLLLGSCFRYLYERGHIVLRPRK